MADRNRRRISTLGSRITSLVSVALVLILAGLAAMTAIAGKQLTDDVRRNLGFIVKMERDCNPDAVSTIAQALKADGAVASVDFLSADDILQQESAYLGEDITDMLDRNPYSAEFDVKVCPDYAHPDSIRELVALYSRFEAVDDVVTESAVIEDVDAALAKAGAIFVIIAAILLIICVALINNTVSLSIYSRRFLIHTMKLVGATGAFIRRPFLDAAALNGLISGAVASLVLIGVRAWGAAIDPVVAEALTIPSMALVCVGAATLGVLICLLTAFFATRRYLRASYDEMFLK